VALHDGVVLTHLPEAGPDDAVGTDLERTDLERTNLERTALLLLLRAAVSGAASTD
jgi:hypothetical protein